MSKKAKNCISCGVYLADTGVKYFKGDALCPDCYAEQTGGVDPRHYDYETNKWVKEV